MKTIDYNELDIISYNHNSGSFAEIDKCIFNGEIYALKRLGKTKGVAALCIGGGEATAIAIEIPA